MPTTTQIARDAQVTGVFFGLPCPLLGLLGLGVDEEKNNRPLVNRKVLMACDDGDDGCALGRAAAAVVNDEIVVRGRARRRVWRMSIIWKVYSTHVRAGWTAS